MTTQTGNSPEEYIDIEEYCKAGKPVPKGKKYLIRVGKALYKVDVESMTGREILQVADCLPVEKHQLNMRMHGGAIKIIKHTDKVDFCQQGLEKFMTIPTEQTEG